VNKQKLFVTCCLSLLTTSMSFALRGDVAKDIAAAFHISNEQFGLVLSPAFWAFAVAIVAGGALVDLVGMRTLHLLSAAGYIGGVLIVTLAPRPAAPVASLFDNPGTTMMYVGFLIMGLSQGLVEAVINPLTVSVYPEEKTKRLVMLHAWWPGGQIVGGLLAVALTSVWHASWQTKLSLIAIPAVVYLFMAMSMKYPQTERVASNVSTAEMWRQCARPLFVVMFFCNGMAAAVELGPDQWFPKVMGDIVPQLLQGQGVVFLIYTAGLMFLIRTFGSGVSQKSPLGTLIVCSLLTFVGLFWLGGLRPGASPLVAFMAATLFGVGKTYFSPTMMGVLSEQLPRGGALVMSVMGGAGMLSVSVAVPAMGARIDRLGAGAALQMMSWLGAVLALLYGAMWLYFRSRGGYQVVRLSSAGDH
jgi:MFS family permease